MLQPLLTLVHPEDGRWLVLTYDSGERRRFDVSPYMNGPWFDELNDRSYFDAVRIVGGGSGIEWSHGQDIAPHELYELSVPL